MCGHASWTSVAVSVVAGAVVAVREGAALTSAYSCFRMALRWFSHFFRSGFIEPLRAGRRVLSSRGLAAAVLCSAGRSAPRHALEALELLLDVVRALALPLGHEILLLRSTACAVVGAPGGRGGQMLESWGSALSEQPESSSSRQLALRFSSVNCFSAS